MEKYTGGCHCKKVRYEAELDLSHPVLECNCTHCAIKGALLSFTPETSFAFTSGEDTLTEYRFNTEKIAHLFCSVCGVEVCGKAADKEGKPTVAVNVRTVDGVELETLARHSFDGKSI